MTLNDKFPLRGVIEGFYGYYYTFSERNDLIKFIGENNFNYYIYAPKNDRQHRDYWREPYPEKIMQKFAKTVRIAKESRVKFNYALSPISMCYSQDEDIEIIKKKLYCFYNIGVRDFSLFIDDIPHRFPHEIDNEKFNSSAEAHAFLANQIYDWLEELDRSCQLIICPTDYHGKPPYSKYTKELGERVYPGIDIFFTGPEICSQEIKANQVEDFGKAINRKPLIWDNYPVNDLAMQPEMHIGSIRGRDKELSGKVKGIIINTMIQAEASKVPLITFKDYFTDPESYDADKSWLKALSIVGGKDALHPLEIFGELSQKSCLNNIQAEKMTNLVGELLISLIKGEKTSNSKELQDLEEYLGHIDLACYFLLNWMDNTKLRNDLLPWIDLLKHKYWMGKRALLVIKAYEKGEDYQESKKLMQESVDNVKKHNKSIAGNSLELLVDYINGIVE